MKKTDVPNRGSSQHKQSPSVADLYNLPGHLIRRLQQIALAIFAEETKDFGVTAVQYAALQAIRTNPGVDQIRLAGLIAYDRTTIGGVVERLEKKELIERKIGATDRRTRLLYVTQAGEQLLQDIAPAVVQIQQKILEPLSPSEQTTFIAMLTQLVDLNNERSRSPLTRSDLMDS